MECKEFVKSLADPFHCRNCRRTLQEHESNGALESDRFDFITVILDRSGSMQQVKNKTIEGFNAYLDEQRSAGKALFTLVQFDDEYEVLYDAAPIDIVEHRTAANYQPRGSTALLDAIGRAVAATSEQVSKLSVKPKCILVSVITDGLENASVEFCGEKGRRQIFQMIEERKKEGWQFFFIGAEPKAIEDAVQEYGFSASHTTSYAVAAPDEAFALLSRANIASRAGLNCGFGSQGNSNQPSRGNSGRPSSKTKRRRANDV
jgi:hypothetical protein